MVYLKKLIYSILRLTFEHHPVKYTFCEIDLNISKIFVTDLWCVDATTNCKVYLCDRARFKILFHESSNNRANDLIKKMQTLYFIALKILFYLMEVILIYMGTC